MPSKEFKFNRLSKCYANFSGEWLNGQESNDLDMNIESNTRVISTFQPDPF